MCITGSHGGQESLIDCNLRNLMQTDKTIKIKKHMRCDNTQYNQDVDTFVATVCDS